MKVAITGATGFVGRAVVELLHRNGHQLKCWSRPSSDRASVDAIAPVEWVAGELGDAESARELVAGCDAVVHSGLWRSGPSFQAAEADVAHYAQVNIVGSIQLIEAAAAARARRFVFVSTCAVHDQILNDRPLDEAHPLWAKTHYGAYKAAVEKFVHSFGLGADFPICALRPTGIYGPEQPIERSKWYELVKNVADGHDVEVKRGGKEVHVQDVAKAIELLLAGDEDFGKQVSGQSYACYDRYVSEHEVASIAKELTGSQSGIVGPRPVPKHEIDTSKIRKLGMAFGGECLLRQTIEAMV